MATVCQSGIALPDNIALPQDLLEVFASTMPGVSIEQRG